jgi:dimethylhistidine N-methyltransferase
MSAGSVEAEGRLRLLDLHPAEGDMRAEVIQGLSSNPKTLPCKYFYDAKGSGLFDRICELEEYYPTRTEISILDAGAKAIAERLGENVLLLELGSGSSTKTDILLRALHSPAGYVPVDISKQHLRASAERINHSFPDLPVHPVCADFTQELELPALGDGAESRFVFFPGSTIGNFESEGQRDLLGRIAELCRPQGGGLLIGVDLVKDVGILEAAYNDREGVTAEFNLNLLERLNRDLDADFDPSRFRHRAIFNTSEKRIEMYLVSETRQRVSIGEHAFEIEPGEAICSEHSHKFRVDEFSALAGREGFSLDAYWTDDQELFAVLLLRLA